MLTKFQILTKKSLGAFHGACHHFSYVCCPGHFSKDKSVVVFVVNGGTGSSIEQAIYCITQNYARSSLFFFPLSNFLFNSNDNTFLKTDMETNIKGNKFNELKDN